MGSARQPQDWNGQSGFTLIELLVSLTILTMLLGIVSSALRTLSMHWNANASGIERLEMISRAFDIFERDVSGMRRLTRIADVDRRFIFSGTANRLSFVTVEPPYPTAPGLYFVDYSNSATNGKNELIRARAPYQAGMSAFPGATPANKVSLLDGPFAYKFSYAEKGKRQGSWLATWKKPNRLPDLIRLQIVDARSGDEIAHPFIAAVRADAEVGCVSDGSDGCSARTGGEFHQSTPVANATKEK